MRSPLTLARELPCLERVLPTDIRLRQLERRHVRGIHCRLLSAGRVGGPSPHSERKGSPRGRRGGRRGRVGGVGSGHDGVVGALVVCWGRVYEFVVVWMCAGWDVDGGVVDRKEYGCIQDCAKTFCL